LEESKVMVKLHGNELVSVIVKLIVLMVVPSAVLWLEMLDISGAQIIKLDSLEN